LFKDNDKFLEIAIQSSAKCESDSQKKPVLKFATERQRESYRNCIIACKACGSNWTYVPEKYRGKKMVMAAVAHFDVCDYISQMGKHLRIGMSYKKLSCTILVLC
jgi:hypothetical protein